MKYNRDYISTNKKLYKYVGETRCTRSNYLFNVIGYYKEPGKNGRYLVTFDLDMTLDNMDDEYVLSHKGITVVEGSIKPKFPPGYDRNRNESEFNYTQFDITSICRRTWRSLVHRNIYKGQQIYYADIEICDEWLNSQDKFIEWYMNEMPVKGKFAPHMHIDKDALQCRVPKEDKIYSPDTCILVTGSLNILLTTQNHRDHNLPVGVRAVKYKTQTTYQVFCQGISKNCCSSRSFKDVKEAFIFFKMLKEYKLIYEAKEAYNKGKINKRAYDALNKFVVIDPNRIVKDSDVMKWLYDRYPYPTYRSYYELRELYFKEFDIEKLMHKRQDKVIVRFS